jgi:transcriptional regulator with XRE-family HTH domain
LCVNNYFERWADTVGQRKRTKADLGEAIETGRRLREARELIGLTQAQLGAAIGGRSQQVIDRYESGQSRIPLGVAIRICRELEVRLEWLAEGVGPVLTSEDEAARGIFWSTYYACVLRDRLTEELDSAAKNSSIDQKIRRACQLAWSALKDVHPNELTLCTFQRLIWEIVRPLNLLLTERPPDREPRVLHQPQEQNREASAGPGRAIDELQARLGGTPLPHISRKYLKIDGGSPAKEAISRNEERRRAEKAFDKHWPGWVRRKAKNR